MKKTAFLLVALMATITNCKKSTTNVNVVNEPHPSYTVDGIHDVTVTNATANYATLPLTVQYNDSNQQTVTLSLSGLPANVSIDTTWITSGIPTFNTTLAFYDTTTNGATAGTYPLTLKATSGSSSRTYTFNLRVLNTPSCASTVTGSYTSSTTSCTSGSFTTIVTEDAAVSNKIWFSNFGNLGISIYGTLQCSTGYITIPSQTVGGVTYYGTVYRSGTHYIAGTYYSSVSSCSIYMH